MRATPLPILNDPERTCETRFPLVFLLVNSSVDYLCHIASRYMYGGGAVKPNNFSHFADYFIKREIVRAVATVSCPEDDAAVNFLMSVLKGNTNAGNKYDDDHYVADLLNSAAIAG